jgi:predicted metal-dependent enzyme (double-stranded beta helix superfamily)
MTVETYTISDLASDLRDIAAGAFEEREILRRVRFLALRAAASSSAWMEKRFYTADAEQGFGVHLLHEEPDHALAIMAVSWLPHRGAPPHDHGTWAVLAGVDGVERNVLYERIDDRSRAGHAELRQVTVRNVGEAQVLTMAAGSIHAVSNDSDRTTLSLHIYGRNVQYLARSSFDPGKCTQTPFTVKA